MYVKDMRAASDAQSPAATYLKQPELVFQAKSHAGQRAVIAEIEKIAAQHGTGGKRDPRVYIFQSWGGWSNIEMPPRPLDSVILPDGQLERIVSDIERFLASEREYIRRGLPWHRGHFYTGPPGTGKTSIARALAGHFKMDIWYLPVADDAKDSDILKKVALIPPKSILLLEDVDVFHAATRRADDGSVADAETGGHGVTMAGLLNALDGVTTPHGLITIMTSNFPAVLDDAVKRPGRVDLTEEFSYTTTEQCEKILSHYYHVDHAVISAANAHRLDGLAPADVMEVCKRHDEWQDALSALIEKLLVATTATTVEGT